MEVFIVVVLFMESYNCLKTSLGTLKSSSCSNLSNPLPITFPR